MGTLKIKFPHSEEYEFEAGKQVVLLGANGAGKTRLSVKIEELNDPRFSRVNAKGIIPIHRIAAQKSLSIKESISILDNESAQTDLFFGNPTPHATKNVYRYSSNPATNLLDDFNKALSL